MTAHSRDAGADESSAAARASDTSTPRSKSGSRTTVPRWERVVIAALGGALLAFGLRRRSLGGTAIALVGGWVSYQGISGRGRLFRVLESTVAGRDRRRSGAAADSRTVRRSVTVGLPADELSAFLRDPENLNRVAGHFADVTSEGEDRHHWSVRGPRGRRLSWETRIAEDTPGEILRLEPVDGTPLFTDWSVSFRPAPADRGTQVTLAVQFDPPGGALGSAALKGLDVVPDALVGEALDRFKSLAETGEIPTLERNPSARGKGDLL